MSLSITILGSSSALPTSNRSLTAHLVNHDERFFLLDCGEGTQMQLRKYNNKIGRINHIFFSHLHGDHVFGLFGLISSMSMLGRKIPLHVYSNPKLEDIINSHLTFFNDNIQFPIQFHSFGATKPQILYSDNKLEVSTIPLKHRIPCVGFLFKEKPGLLNIRKEMIEFYELGVKDIVNIKNGYDFVTNDGKKIPNSHLTFSTHKPKSFAYCTDTKQIKSISELIKGIDLLYHEATFLHKDVKLAKQTYHSTALQAAEIAREAEAGKLLLGHFSPRYKHEEAFLIEAREIFENTVLAEDGLQIIV